MGKFLKMLLLLPFMHFHITFSLQNAYWFVYERCDITEINENIVANMTHKCYKVNRTNLYLNYSYISNVDITSNKDAHLSIDTGFFRSNEYRYGPIKFNIPLCDVMTHQDYDIPYMLNHSNLHPCPIKKGEFLYAYHLRPGASNFPPLLPEGRWKLMVKLVYKETIAYSVNWYFKVVYPLPFA